MLRQYKRYYVKTLVMCLRCETAPGSQIAHGCKIPVLPPLLIRGPCHLRMSNQWIIPPLRIRGPCQLRMSNQWIIPPMPKLTHIYPDRHPLQMRHKANLLCMIVPRISLGHHLNLTPGRMGFHSCHLLSFPTKGSASAHHSQTPNAG